MTPTSAARMLFSPSVSPEASAQEHLAQLTILEQIKTKRAAATAAAQELKMLEDAAIEAGILLSTVPAAAQPTTADDQEPDQMYQPAAAKPQLNPTAQEPALHHQAPIAARAATTLNHLSADQEPDQHNSMTDQEPDQTNPNAAAEPQLTDTAQDTQSTAAAKPHLPAQHSLNFLQPAGSKHCQLDSILLQALSTFTMEEKLTSTKMGISSIADLHRVTTDRHEDIKALLSDPNAPGESLRKDFSEFYFSFKGAKDCSPATAAAVTIYHASKVSSGFKLLINQALQAGIGSSIVQIEVMAAAADSTGRLPDRKASHEQVEAMDNGDWIGMLNLTVALLCYDDNKEQTFEVKRKELEQADLSEFKKSTEALAHILSLHQAATVAYGSEYMTMYDLLKLIKPKLTYAVRHEMEETIANDKSIDLRHTTWRKIEDLITTAWGTASRRPEGYHSRIGSASDQAAPNPPAAQMDHDAKAEHTMHPAILAATTQTPGDFSDKTLQCQRFNDDGTKCNADFVWSASEQSLHKRLGYMNEPKSCPKHKQPPRNYASDKCKGASGECSSHAVEQCRLFQRGECSYGDQCKFSHVEPPKQLAIGHHMHLNEEDDEELIEW